jgi:hypothetical protein
LRRSFSRRQHIVSGAGAGFDQSVGLQAFVGPRDGLVELHAAYITALVGGLPFLAANGGDHRGQRHYHDANHGHHQEQQTTGQPITFIEALGQSDGGGHHK